MHTPICAVFDMDGTLADTSLITVPACIKAANEYGIAPPARELITQTIGISGLDFYRRLYPALGEEKLEPLASRVFELEKSITRELGPGLLFPGILDMLNRLARAGIPMAIASTGETAHVESVLTTTGTKQLFAAIKCNSNDKITMLKELCTIYSGHKLYMVGDKPKDSDAAKANGVYSIGIGYGFSAPCELAGFDEIAGSPGEVLRLMGV